MTYLQMLVEPKQWQAGSIGSEPNMKPFFFDCADCEAKEPVIKGFLTTTPEPAFEKIVCYQRGYLFKLALFCWPCFDKRLAEANKEKVEVSA